MLDSSDPRPVNLFRQLCPGLSELCIPFPLSGVEPYRVKAKRSVGRSMANGSLGTCPRSTFINNRPFQTRQAALSKHFLIKHPISSLAISVSIDLTKFWSLCRLDPPTLSPPSPLPPPYLLVDELWAVLRKSASANHHSQASSDIINDILRDG